MFWIVKVDFRVVSGVNLKLKLVGCDWLIVIC